MEIIYLSLKMCIEYHSKIIEKSGGRTGFSHNGQGQLDSILYHIQNDDYYESFLDKLVHLLSSVAKFHVFTDGNKRSSLAFGSAFLLLNGFSERTVSTFMQEMENYIVWLVENRINENDLKTKLEYLIYDIDEPIEFKEYILNKIDI